MSDTYKIIFTALIFNLIIGFVITAMTISAPPSNEVDYAIEQNSRTTDIMLSDEWELSQSSNLIEPDTWGSGTGMSLQIIKQVFWNNFVTIPKMSSNNGIELLMVIMVALFRGWLYVLLLIEGYKLIKNKT